MVQTGFQQVLSLSKVTGLMQDHRTVGAYLTYVCVKIYCIEPHIQLYSE